MKLYIYYNIYTRGGKPWQTRHGSNPMHQAPFWGPLAGLHQPQHRLPSIQIDCHLRKPPCDHIDSASESSGLPNFCNPGLCGSEMVWAPGAFWRSASESSPVVHLAECHLRQWPQIPASACSLGCHLGRVDWWGLILYSPLKFIPSPTANRNQKKEI